MSVAFFTVFHSSLALSDQFDGSGRGIPEISVQVISLQTSTGFCHCRLYALAFHSLGLSSYRYDNGRLRSSTTGGIKCIRMVILFKVAKNEFKHILHPNAVLPVRVNKQVISPLSSLPYWHLHFCMQSSPLSAFLS